jgi:hypothetical protein
MFTQIHLSSSFVSSKIITVTTFTLISSAHMMHFHGNLVLVVVKVSSQSMLNGAARKC